jgi:hypothetical protein
MSIQSVRPVGVGLPTPATSPAAPVQAVPTRPSNQVRKVRSSEDQNVFNPPGVISRLVRSMRADEYIRMDAVSRGSELANSKGYPADTMMEAVASRLLNGS